jgi:RHS repeat-associated protein
MAYLNVPNNGNAGSDNKYLYNNKELQDENLGGIALNLYDYGARFYDPQIGRFTTIDPKTEKYNNWTPYLYAADNPIKFIDKNGEGPGEDLLMAIAVRAAKYSAKQQDNQTALNSIGGTLSKMTPPTNVSLGEDITSMEAGVSFNLTNNVSAEVKAKVALNEEKGVVSTTSVSLTVGKVLGAKMEASGYQGQDGKTKVETKADAGIVIPSLPSSPVKVNGSALLRTIGGLIETAKNYCNQKMDEVTNREKYVQKEDN